MLGQRLPNVNWQSLALGISMIGFGTVSWWDAQRITRTLRRPGVYDMLGPDHYLDGIAWILIVLGVLLIVSALRVSPSAAPQEATGTKVPFWGAHLWLLAAMAGYTAALPWLGFLGATVLFFVASFRIVGMRSWSGNILYSIIFTLAFAAIFLWATGMPLKLLPVGL